MRIAFTGASGTGKTTLAEFVAETFDLPINPVGSRSVAEAMGFENPATVPPEHRGEFQQRLLVDKIQWELDHDAFVTDRTPIDNLTYNIMLNGKSVTRGDLADVEAGTQRYHRVYYLPISVFQKVGDDAARDFGADDFHHVYDKVLFGLTCQMVKGRAGPRWLGSIGARRGAVDMDLRFLQAGIVPRITPRH